MANSLATSSFPCSIAAYGMGPQWPTTSEPLFEFYPTSNAAARLRHPLARRFPASPSLVVRGPRRLQQHLPQSTASTPPRTGGFRGWALNARAGKPFAFLGTLHELLGGDRHERAPRWVQQETLTLRDGRRLRFAHLPFKAVAAKDMKIFGRNQILPQPFSSLHSAWSCRSLQHGPLGVRGCWERALIRSGPGSRCRGCSGRRNGCRPPGVVVSTAC